MKKFLSIFILSLASAYVSAYERNHEHCILIDQMRACYDLPKAGKMLCLKDTSEIFKPSRDPILTEDEARRSRNVKSSFQECGNLAIENIDGNLLNQCTTSFMEVLYLIYGCS